MKKLFFIIMLLCSTIWSFATTIKTVEYIPGSGLNLDIYLPSNVAALHACVIIGHAGDGNYRDKGTVGKCNKYHNKGYVSIAIDYGPSDPLTGDRQKTDALNWDCAVRYLKMHATEYGINANKIVDIGTSAGGV